MVKRKESTTPKEEKEKFQKIEIKYDLKDEEKELFEANVERINKKYLLKELKSEAEQISIETTKKTKKELAEGISYFYLLLSRLPIDTKLWIISFLSVEMDTQNWIDHEINKIQGVNNSKTPSFYRDCFGYFDSSKTPYFLFQNIIGSLSLHSGEGNELDSDESQAHLELYKCLCNYSKYIDHGCETFLKGFSEIHFNIIKHFHFKKMKVSFDVYVNRLQFIDLSNVIFLEIQDFCYYTDLTKFNFSKVTELKVNNKGFETELTEDEEDLFFNFIKSLKLKSLYFDLNPVDPLKVIEIIKAQKSLKYLEINISPFQIDDILDIECYSLTIHNFDFRLLSPIKLSKSLKLLKVFSIEDPVIFMENIHSIENIEYIELQFFGYYRYSNTKKVNNLPKIKISKGVKNFLKLCNEKKITLDVNFLIPSIIKEEFSDIKFV